MRLADRIYVAGHTGMVGSAIVRNLRSQGYTQVIVATSTELDLRNQSAVLSFFKKEKPDFIFLAAAKVGGILANDLYRAEFLYDNLTIQTNVIHASHLHNVKKLLFLGSSCVYPRSCPQPIREEYLLTGSLEPTNEPYAIAKIAGIKMCETYRQQYGCNFISVMPSNLYGPNDNYDPMTSHVIAALVRKIWRAKQFDLPHIEVWGTGTPRREFLHVDDLAKACVYLMHQYSDPRPINIGTGTDISILDLANLISSIIEYKGKIVFDYSKPDGTIRKVLDTSRINALGWKPEISLESGLANIVNLLECGYITMPG
jgi:GDP-L-fucose synthase